MIQMKPELARLIAALLLLAATPAWAQSRVALGYLPSNDFMAAFVAKDKGFFAKRGLEVSFHMQQSGSMFSHALANGSMQVATLTPPAVLRANDAGANIQIVAGAAVLTRDHPTAGIVAGKQSNIRVAEDFRNKKIGVPGLHGVNHIAFMKWLRDRSVDPRTVQYVSVLLPQMREMLADGRIDAALPVEPFLTQIQQSGAGHLVSNFPGELAKSYLESVYVMPRSWVLSNPQAVVAFREGLREGAQWIANNEQAARKTQVRYLKVSEASAMAATLPEFVIDVHPADIEFWVELCRQFGVTKGSLSVAELLAK